ncbi:MAG: FAD-binding oxidoreductase [Acholeplasmataceae bacterium]|nr:FAD-binding oxidoreductase [Acholeplasmataceae bacterium]
MTLLVTNTDKYSNLGLLITMIFGSFAYTWISYQFVLSSRPKFIETSFGMDKLYQFHGLMAIVSISIAIIHAIVNEQLLGKSFITTLGGLSLGLFILISLLAMLLMSPTFILKYRPFKWLKIKIDNWKKFSYEQLRIIHNLTLVAFVVLNVHVLLTSNAREYAHVRTLYWIYMIISVVFYIYHKYIKQEFLQKNPYLIVDTKQENSLIWTIKMRAKKKSIKRDLPGQFAFFSFKTEVQKFEEHPFSISFSNKLELSITVKKLGDFTNKISNLKIGDEVLVEGPFGRFSYLLYPKEKETIFIAGGIGITPILSMLRYMSVHEPNRKVLLIWGINTLSDFICKDELYLLAKTMSKLSIVPVVAYDDDYQGERGYIDSRIINKTCLKENINMSSAGFYICGPKQLTQISTSTLKNSGIKKKRIHFEKFSL